MITQGGSERQYPLVGLKLTVPPEDTGVLHIIEKACPMFNIGQARRMFNIRNIRQIIFVII